MKIRDLFGLMIVLALINSNSHAQSRSGKIIDKRDNQEYKWVSINNQIWLTQNINLYSKDESWYFNNDSISNKDYGRLYSYRIALKVCPEGWHLPTMKEFEKLIEFYGSEENAAVEMLKEDSLGLNVKLKGWRSFTGTFGDCNLNTGFWASTENKYDNELASGIEIYNDHVSIWEDLGKICGFYVRCIKNE